MILKLKNKYDNYIRSTFHNDHLDLYTTLEDSILPSDDNQFLKISSTYA